MAWPVPKEANHQRADWMLVVLTRLIERQSTCPHIALYRIVSCRVAHERDLLGGGVKRMEGKQLVKLSGREVHGWS